MKDTCSQPLDRRAQVPSSDSSCSEGQQTVISPTPPGLSSRDEQAEHPWRRRETPAGLGAFLAGLVVRGGGNQ